MPILQAPTLRDVYAIDSKNIWIVGGGDKTEQIAGFAPRVLVYDGTSVLDVPLPVTDRIVRGVWGADANNVWVVGDGGLGSGGSTTTTTTQQTQSDVKVCSSTLSMIACAP